MPERKLKMTKNSPTDFPANRLPHFPSLDTLRSVSSLWSTYYLVVVLVLVVVLGLVLVLLLILLLVPNDLQVPPK